MDVSASGSDIRPGPEQLEQLWAGDFGQAYVARNAEAGSGRGPFWEEAVAATGMASALEVGCNIGGNLQWLAPLLGTENVAGVDVNASALKRLRERIPGIDVRAASARSLPFENASFDLVYTFGVLIHLPDESLGAAMDEIVRCSRRWVLCTEYAAREGEEQAEVPYHGERGALFRRDYERIYRQRHPELELIESRYQPFVEGAFDDATISLLRKPDGG